MNPTLDHECGQERYRLNVRRDRRVWARTNGRCWYCGRELEWQTFHVEHMVPKSQGGRGGGNLVPACAPCNLSKGPLNVEQFRRKRQRQRDGRPVFTVEEHDWLARQGFVFPEVEPYLFWFERDGLD